MAREIADLFENSSYLAWNLFEQLPGWQERENVVQSLLSRGGTVFEQYKQCYRSALSGIILEDFYSANPEEWARVYREKGEISLELLDPAALPMLAQYAETVEPLGKSRYGTERPCYPPGEVALKFDVDDPRATVFTEVNMSAVGSCHMSPGSGVEGSPVQWIYHSPQLREFLRVVMGSKSLHPYMSDLGVAINIMRPTPMGSERTALGFHFDSIDSSSRCEEAIESDRMQPRGATGVIGIKDCTKGGERIVFPSVRRAKVEAVRAVTSEYDPDYPHRTIGADVPVVFTGPTAGVLYLFDGGDLLHGVSAVRDGARIAAVFLFQEDAPPASTVDGAESSNFFYGKDVEGADTAPKPTPPVAAVGNRQQEVYTHGRYDSVYHQSSAELYDQWAFDPEQDYDQTVAQGSVAVLSVHDVMVATVKAMAPLSTPLLILDAGCGTGRVAEVCRERAEDCPELSSAIFDGIDYSRGMLTVCQKKGPCLYRNLIQADLTKPFPSPATTMDNGQRHDFNDSIYGGVVSSGTFLQGHVGPEALPELCRVLRPGGFMVFSVRPSYFEETRAQWLDTLKSQGMVNVEISLKVYNKEGLQAPIISCYKSLQSVL